MSKQAQIVRTGGLAILLVLSMACSGAAERKVSYLNKGAAFFKEQNYDKAGVELRNALQIDPKYAEARYLFGRVAEKRGELREAVGHYQSVVDESPGFLPARAALARLYLLGGVPEKARELVDSGLKAAPNDAALLTVRAGIEASAGNVVRALADAEAAFKTAPNDENTIALLASLLRQEGKTERAIEIVKQGISAIPGNIDLHIVLADLEAKMENFPAVEAELNEMIRLQPAVLAHRASLVQFHLFRKNPQGAESAWRKAIVDLPEQQDPKLALLEFLRSQRGDDIADKEMQLILADKSVKAPMKLAIGSYLERQNKGERAEQLYKEVLQVSGTDGDGLSARNRLAALYLRKKENSKAEALVAEVLKENARDSDALILRAEMAMQKGDPTTAITDLRGVLRDQPNSAPLMRALAMAHLQNKETALAEETLRTALQTNPGDIPLRKELARLLLQQDKADQAKPLLTQLSGVQGASDDIEFLDLQFKTQLLTKDYAAATATAEKMQQLQPKAAMGWYYAGMSSEAQGGRDAARKSYELALERQPMVAEPLTSLVRLDISDGNAQRAIERLNKVIATHPEHGLAYNLRGEVQLAGKQWQAAADSFQKGLEIAPTMLVLYRGYALAQLGDKKIDAAVATYRTGIEKTRSGVLTAELAALLERLNRHEESIKEYQQWLLREPKSQMAANNLAMLLLNYRNDKASVAEAEKLVGIIGNSTDVSMLDTRGWVRFKAGDYQGAVNLLQQAASTLPDSNIVRYHLGMAQWKAGNASSARSNLQAALKDGKAFFGMDDAKKTLAALGAG
jgi:tetratricopeptide (TPR) repeat protein